MLSNYAKKLSGRLKVLGTLTHTYLASMTIISENPESFPKI
jgi:hypothetical protein